MASEKAFEPTQSRVDRAKREGNVARSQELGNVAAFSGALIATCAIVSPFTQCVRTMLAIGASAGHNIWAALAALALMLVPAAAAASAAVAANLVQSGGLRLTPVTIKPERLAPAENFRRMFSREAAITAIRATLAFTCAAAALVPAFASICMASLHADRIASLAAAAWSGSLHTAEVCCAVGSIFAAADYGMQLARWRKRLRMSHEELKRDQKEHDGDPLARGRRRMLHRTMARSSLQKLKRAAFVVTNPTHVAVALEYRPPNVPVPRVLIRARDETAVRAKAAAAQFGIPIVENVVLARILYQSGQAGEFIPLETYVAVAEVVAKLTARQP